MSEKNPPKGGDAHQRAINAAWSAYLSGDYAFARKTENGLEPAFPIAFKQVSRG